MLRLMLSAMCAVGLSFSFCSAGSIGSVIGTNVLSRLSDNSLEVLQNSDGAGGFLAPGVGDTTVDIGDRLITIFRVDQVSSPFGSPDVLFGTNGWTDESTGVAVIEVNAKESLGLAGFAYGFTAPSIDPLGLGWSAGTMVGFYSDPANDYTGSPGSIVDGIGQASGGSAWWEFGMTAPGTAPLVGLGAANANAAGEYWTATAGTDDITLIGLADPSTSLGSFQVGLNLIAQNNGLPLVPVNAAGLELTAGGNLLGNGSDPVPGGFQAFDDLNFSIRAVPEPGSIAIWSVIGLVGAVGYRRRLSKKA